MKAIPPPADPLIPLALLEEVQALALVEHRPADEIVREAISEYLRQRSSIADLARRTTDAERRAARDAGVRIHDRQQFRPMPDGMTIRDLIDFGRR